MTNTHDSLSPHPVKITHTPRVQLIPAALSDRNALHNLAQFYQYDFTEFLPGDVDEQGEYPYMDVQRYLTDKGHRAYLARVNGKLGGFVLVRDRPEQRDRSGRYLAEFFVMRPYRQLGVGRTLAFQTFDTFRGYWELAIVGPNIPAQAFWRKVVGEYTQGRFEEFTTQESDGGSTITIIWQAFDNREW
jgi:predicted acetyltransferase